MSTLILFVAHCNDKIIPVSELFAFTYIKANGDEIHTLRARTQMNNVYIIYTGSMEEIERIIEFIVRSYQIPYNGVIDLTESRIKEIISHYKKQSENIQ